jgi:hypothetical protein
MRLSDPDIRLREIRPKQQPVQSSQFRRGECLRLTYDQLRDAPQSMTTRDLAERIMCVKAVPATDDHL